MVYKVYTDGACNTQSAGNFGKMSVSYLIRTGDTYLTMDMHVLNQGGLARIAESIAIGIAVEELMNTVELQKEDFVRIYVDCVPVIKMYAGAGKPDKQKPFFHDKRELATWDILCELRKKCRWGFEWTKAHKDGVVDENKVADRLAKYALEFGK